MNEKIRTIRLYGVAGAMFGRNHRLAVRSTREAVHALCKMVPGFEKFMMNARDNGLTFAVFNGKRNLTEDQLEDPIGDEAIRIAPILRGSKNAGLFQTILGAALVVVGVITSPYGGGFLIGIGASMAIGGVFQMLSPQTTTNTGDSADTKGSYYFNGPVNGSTQGDPIPYGFGEMIVGSKVGSDGIYAEDQA